MNIRRTTVAAASDDLEVLQLEARRRGVSLARVLAEAVANEVARVRGDRGPRFAVVRGDGRATSSIERDEHAPARRRGRS